MAFVGRSVESGRGTALLGASYSVSDAPYVNADTDPEQAPGVASIGRVARMPPPPHKFSDAPVLTVLLLAMRVISTYFVAVIALLFLSSWTGILLNMTPYGALSTSATKGGYSLLLPLFSLLGAWIFSIHYTMLHDCARRQYLPLFRLVMVPDILFWLSLPARALWARVHGTPTWPEVRWEVSEFQASRKQSRSSVVVTSVKLQLAIDVLVLFVLYVLPVLLMLAGRSPWDRTVTFVEPPSTSPGPRRQSKMKEDIGYLHVLVQQLFNLHAWLLICAVLHQLAAGGHDFLWELRARCAAALEEENHPRPAASGVEVLHVAPLSIRLTDGTTTTTSVTPSVGDPPASQDSFRSARSDSFRRRPLLACSSWRCSWRGFRLMLYQLARGCCGRTGHGLREQMVEVEHTHACFHVISTCASAFAKLSGEAAASDKPSSLCARLRLAFAYLLKAGLLLFFVLMGLIVYGMGYFPWDLDSIGMAIAYLIGLAIAVLCLKVLTHWECVTHPTVATAAFMLFVLMATIGQAINQLAVVKQDRPKEPDYTTCFGHVNVADSDPDYIAGRYSTPADVFLQPTSAVPLLAERYAICDQRWYGLDAVSLGMLASKLAYMPPSPWLLNTTRVLLPGWEYIGGATAGSQPYWIEIYNAERDVSIVAIRGTNTFAEAFYDLQLGVSTGIVDWIMRRTLPYFDLLFLESNKPFTFRKATAGVIPGLVLPLGRVHDYMNPLIEYIQTKTRGHEVLLTGHSLGGGLSEVASVLAEQKNGQGVHAVVFEAPHFYGAVQGFFWDSLDRKTPKAMNGNTHIRAKSDLVAMVGTPQGLTQDIFCDGVPKMEGALGLLFGCHLTFASALLHNCQQAANGTTTTTTFPVERVPHCPHLRRSASQSFAEEMAFAEAHDLILVNTTMHGTLLNDYSAQ